MPVRLIALDLDYTLLDSTHQIPAANLSAIREAQAAGLLVVLASARPPRSMRRYHEQIGLQTPVVAYNGALIYDLLTCRALHHLPIPLPAARSVVAYLRAVDPELNISLECADVWHIDQYGDDLRQVVVEYGIDPPHGVGTVDTVLATGSEAITKILFTAANLGEAELAELDQRLGPEVCAVRTSDRLVEVMAAGATKANAMAWVAESLGVAAAETLALGDNYNDIPLLQWAGIGVAMGNAPDTVKRAADAVTLTHDEAGVAAAIQQYAL
ncbi:MAG: HAD family phosphatase [Armatimonadetes bacterium]|jgi:Cof subfamily protein (haloacid dehalogenase superfamily)|nr:HAD family phosphatase [Armatimonadota bacterium]